MNVTIRDVAKRAGVGVATVSRVINNSELVSPGTAPGGAGRHRRAELRPESNGAPLVAWPDINHWRDCAVFHPAIAVERLRGISEVFEGSAYDLVDGVTVMSMSPSEDDVRSLKHSSLPVVLLDAEHPSSSRCSKTARVAAISPPAT